MVQSFMGEYLAHAAVVLQITGDGNLCCDE